MPQQKSRAGAAGAYKLGYRRGREGADQQASQWADHPHGDVYGQGYEAGAADRAKAAPATTEPAAPSTPAPPAPRSSSSGRSTSFTSWMPKEAGGFVLGLFLYAVVLNWARGGPAQAKAWLAAKFLNKTAATGGGGAPASAPPAPPNVASDTGTGAVAPQPYPGGPRVAIPGLGNGNEPLQ